jgi:acetyl-CoA C-acetyltransferase
MDGLHPNTPVLVGFAAVEQHEDDPARAKEAVALMIGATRGAAAAAAAPTLARDVQAVYFPRGTWSYGDPGRLVAQAIDAASVETICADFGVLQQTMIGEACRRIAGGDLQTALIVGGEAQYRQLRARITGVEAPQTPQQSAPDRMIRPAEEMFHPSETEALGMMPVGYYAIMDSAWRAAKGWSIENSRDRVAALYGRMSEIAAANPHAWKREPLAPATIREATSKNPMLAFPYTKLHTSSWNVDQASALLLCSATKAQALSVPEDRWVFPLASTESNYMQSLAERTALGRCPGAAVAGAKALDIAGLDAGRLDFVELYSCFPIAVTCYADELGLDLSRDVTVTGGMPFAGGPLNNYVLQATCRMAELLCRRPTATGLVSSVSGLLTKQGFGVWSRTPGPAGFEFADVSDAVRADNPPRPVVTDFYGNARVAGYTVMYQGGQRQRAVAVVDLPDGGRAVTINEQPEVMESVEHEDLCNRTVTVQGGRFELAGGL